MKELTTNYISILLHQHNNEIKELNKINYLHKFQDKVIDMTNYK